MSKNIFLSILAAFFLQSCEKEPVNNPDNTIDYMYHAHILSPNGADKTMGDMLHITVQFESHSGETVHNVSVEIKNLTTGTVVYSKPDDSHVHETGAQYTFSESTYLNEENGFFADSQWVLEASVWGAESNAEKETEKVYFNIKP